MNTIRILYIGGFLSATKFAKIGEMYIFFIICICHFWWFKKFLIANCNGYDYCVFDIFAKWKWPWKNVQIRPSQKLLDIALYTLNLMSNSEGNLIVLLYAYH